MLAHRMRATLAMRTAASHLPAASSTCAAARRLSTAVEPPSPAPATPAAAPAPPAFTTAASLASAFASTPPPARTLELCTRLAKAAVAQLLRVKGGASAAAAAEAAALAAVFEAAAVAAHAKFVPDPRRPGGAPLVVGLLWGAAVFSARGVPLGEGCVSWGLGAGRLAR